MRVHTALSGGTLKTVAHFLLGYKTKDGDQKQGVAGIDKAFESPDSLRSCVTFVRDYWLVFVLDF